MISICHIVNLITGKSDGVYKHLRMIFELSDKNNFEHILIFQGSKKIETELKELGIKFFVIDSLNKKISLQTFLEMFRIIKKINPDIIHTHLIKSYSIAGLLDIYFRKKFIFNYHGSFIYNNFYYSFLERFIYRTIHFLIYLFKVNPVVLVPSEASKQLLLSQTKYFPEINVYYNGYHSLKTTGLEVANKEILELIIDLRKKYFVITVIGRLEIQKRIDRAIMLMEKIIAIDNKVKLLIFGDGDLKSELKTFINQLKLNDFVYLFDYVQNIENYFSNFDIILFTSEWEGLPLTVWEAMAHRVPVIAPDLDGFREILIEDNCGLIYEPGNIEDAKIKILKIINDNGLRNELGLNGRAAIKTKYNSQNFINKIEDTYSYLINK